MGKADEPQLVYLDANCFIDWAQGEASAPAVESWLIAGRQGRVQLPASTLTLAEARGDMSVPDAIEKRQRIRTLLLESYVMLVEVTRRVGLIANDITVDRTRIRGADAAQLACAVFAGADLFLTRNFRDFSAGDVYRGVRFSEPYEYGGEGLFDSALVT